jgi:HK97 gp10 family phage protein
MFSVSVDTDSLKEALDKLPEHVAKGRLKAALTDGASVLLERIVDMAPERNDQPTPGSNSLPPGMLRADMTMSVKMSEDGRFGSVRVGPTSDTAHVGRFQNNGYPLVKGGRLRRGARKQKNAAKGRVIGYVEGQHFMERAFDEAGQSALNTFMYRLEELLSKGYKPRPPKGTP